MLRSQWGKRSYARALTDTGGGAVGDPGGGRDVGGAVVGSRVNGEIDVQRQGLVNRAYQEGRDMRVDAAKKKFSYQQKLNLENKRKKLGKGNIVTFSVATDRN